MKAICVACRVNASIAIGTVGVFGLSWAQELSGSITDRSSFDRQAVVSTAPADSETSIYAGLGNGEQVQLHNGDLLVSHVSSFTYPINGGGSFGLARVYNSQSLIYAQIRANDIDPGATKSLPVGRSRVGYGWRTHVGRIHEMWGN